MQQKIDNLTAEAENHKTGEDGGDGIGVGKVEELDNEQWMEFIVEEVRKRTVKGTS